MARIDSRFYVLQGNIFVDLSELRKKVADKKKLRKELEKQKGETEEVTANCDRVKNQTFDVSVEDMNCCYCQKTSN